MLDIKYLRENPDDVRQLLLNRSDRYTNEIDALLKLDAQWRGVVTKLEALRSERNKASELIGRYKKEKKDAAPLMKAVEESKAKMKDVEEMERSLAAEMEAILLSLPNVPDKSVPVGKTATDNKVVREQGTKPTFSFKARDHHDVGTYLGLLDFDTATKLSGARFSMFKGAGAKLERSIANFMLDLHTKEHGYTEVATPYLVTKKTMTNTGQLPKFAEELYRCQDDDLYLIPTSEVALANIHSDSVVTADQLPISVTAYTPCFRREAGSYGKDTRGLIRNHQFDKVELVRFCRVEDSLAELEKLTAHAEEVLKRLGLPYRVLALCTGDMGFAAAKTYDLEVWMPGENVWREISSCSTCGDFQARRMNFKVKEDNKRVFGCTLNGSGLAVGRTFAAILENYQNEDGSVTIPEALRPYMGTDRIMK